MTVLAPPTTLAGWLDRHADAIALKPMLQALREFQEPLTAITWRVIETLEQLRADSEVQLAAILHLSPVLRERTTLWLQKSPGLRQLLDGLQAAEQVWSLHAQREGRGNAEGLRRLLLAIIRDLRVVLILLSEQLVRLRAASTAPPAERKALAELTADIHAPLANRLGIWQLKWELEDLAFRYLQPEIYQRIARLLDEKRTGRERFIEDAKQKLRSTLAEAGIAADVDGRPKHIFSIWKKMQRKNMEFNELYDIRAIRVLVDDVADCYATLGLVHQLWTPVPSEFDDYIAKPKGNDYRSLHTAVVGADGRAFEVQIRTHAMHEHAELGVAAHWRYKEEGSKARADSSYDDKIAWLRQLLSWRDEVTDSAAWVEQFKRAALDDTIYVMTPQGRVIDLAKGATPVDFAYRVHTDLGHRCRGARVDGHQVPLNTPLRNGQRVEIVVAKSGGPSRDWLSATQGYLATPRARQKVKQWFAAQQEAAMLAEGRAFVARELQRDGQTQANHEELAHKLGFKNADALFLAAARGEVGARAIQVALRGEPAEAAPEPEIQTRASKVGESKILVVGVDKLLTQLGGCCKPVPPDAVAGFVTRGRGVSVHRVDCMNFRNMAARNPERVIEAQWGGQQEALYAADIMVEANDRQGLLRDISDVLSKEKINVTAVKTLSKSGVARMAFTVELSGVALLQRVLGLVGDVPGVFSVRRG